jgi:hypothetical protein
MLQRRGEYDEKDLSSMRVHTGCGMRAGYCKRFVLDEIIENGQEDFSARRPPLSRIV